MPFNAPLFDCFSVITRNLEVMLGESLKRYNRGDLAALILRFDQFLAPCGSGRTTEAKVLAKVREEVSNIPKDNVVEYAKGLEYFLGAHFHRYLRIWASYDRAAFYNNPMGSKLFVGIRLTLGLSEDPPKDPKELKAADAVILDPLTVFTCLRSFQSNMLSRISANSKSNPKKTVPKYTEFEHLANDSNFEDHLQEMIKDYKIKSAPIMEHYKAIRFLQDVLKQIELDNKNTELAIDTWCKALRKDKINIKNIPLLEEHLKRLDSIKPYTIDTIALCLQLKHYKEHILDNKKIEDLDFATFQIILKQCNLELASHMLSGAYMLVLHAIRNKKYDASYDKFKTVLKTALCLPITESLDNVTILKTTKMLHEFLDTIPNADIDCSFFINRACLNGDLINLPSELVAEPAAAAAPTRSPSATALI